ncbi:hypothetical protein [Empedobacter falsenii]|uniref:hypothetical protein n=1 Tax=Empedobacter falsenii TaxID=343874 RepID=UPI0005705F50|nr:hypothetical protein [Empedobacter falsenii]
MRDPKRIKPLLERIEKIWIENPDYRLGQLIMVIARTGEHNPKLFNLEESELLKKLDEFEKTQNIK